MSDFITFHCPAMNLDAKGLLNTLFENNYMHLCHDSLSLEKGKYILITNMQELGSIRADGKRSPYIRLAMPDQIN